jgi:carbon starvation protein CstA
MISIIVAIVFIPLGFILMKYPPKGINIMYGYRTSLSMKNQDTWDVSQKYGGFSMIIFGAINVILAVWSIIQPMIINKTVQIIFLLIGATVMLIIDEIYLIKLFNKDGTRKKIE